MTILFIERLKLRKIHNATNGCGLPSRQLNGCCCNTGIDLNPKLSSLIVKIKYFDIFYKTKINSCPQIAQMSHSNFGLI